MKGKRSNAMSLLMPLSWRHAIRLRSALQCNPRL
jgi:hypothetical protein